jgi:hypothetical protein
VRVGWLRKALGNLDAEASFIATDDPIAARAVVSSVFAAVDLDAVLFYVSGLRDRLTQRATV